METRLLASPSTRLTTSLILIAVLLGACASVSTATNPPAAATQVTTILEPSTILATPTQESTTEPPVSGVTEGPTEAVAATPIPVATSRGPELEATDPTTVNLASGQVQFVEFFRFT
jgi:hypothetical protein